MRTLFVGGYTKKISDDLIGKGKGIYRLNINQATGELYLLDCYAVTSPSYMTITKERNALFVLEESPAKDKPQLSAYALNDGVLQLLNRQPLPADYACHLISNQQYVIVACYVSGDVFLYPRTAEGHLLGFSDHVKHKGSSANKERQEAAHCHMVCAWQDKHIYVVDLGMDKLVCYEIDDKNHKLLHKPEWDITTPAGCGPRHMLFLPDKTTAIVFAELSGEALVYQWQQDKVLLKQRLATLPADYTGEPWAAAIRLHPNNKWLYLSHRGANIITLCYWHRETNQLEVIDFIDSKGKTPRDFNIDPSGKFLIVAHQDDDSLISFRINEKTGKLTFLHSMDEVKTPTCVIFNV